MSYYRWKLVKHRYCNGLLITVDWGLENKFLENKSGWIFFFPTSLLYKILPTNPLVCKPTSYAFYTSEVKEYYLSYRPRTECSISQIFKKNCTQSIFRTINRGLSAKPFKTVSKITYTVSRFSLLTSAKFAANINRVTLQRNKEFIMLIFFI